MKLSMIYPLMLAPLLLVVTQQAALNETSSAAEETHAVKQKNQGKGKKICREEEVTGSRFKKRTCFTQEQWDARERHAKEFMQEIDRKPISQDGNGGI